jgi:hypothetical protein
MTDPLASETVVAADTPVVGELAMTTPESIFIQQHQIPVVVAMKPYLRTQKAAYAAGFPVNITPPLVSGTGTVGQVLTTTVGTWLTSPTYTFQWYRAGVLIAGATSQTYTLVAGDSGKAVSAVVTATSAGKSTPAASSNSIAVA